MKATQRGNDSFLLPRAGLLVLIICILVLVSLFSQFIHVGPIDRSEAKSRFFTIAFTLTYQNMNSRGDVWKFTDEDKAVGLFMNDSWQTVYVSNVSNLLERYDVDVDGNAVGFMSFSEPQIGPGENFTCRVEYTVVLKPRSAPDVSEEESETLVEIPEDLRSLYCKPEGPWLVNESDLRDLAHRIAENETRVLTVVKRFIAWIRDSIKYERGDIPRYPNETLVGKAGDCDDQANLLITLCRIVGIPAYLQVGCIYLPERSADTIYHWNGSFTIVLTRIAWHGWAVVYVPPWGWLPVDLTYVSPGSLQADPLNAMRMSAIIAYPTVQYANITRTDYVADTRRWRDFLLANEFRTFELDTMDEEEAVEERIIREIMDLRSREIVLLTAFLPSIYLEDVKNNESL